MFGIVLCHWGGHRSWNIDNDNTFLVNKLFLQLVQYFGEIGNCIFVLITGYFCANCMAINKKGLLRVVTDVKFYSVLMFAISIALGMNSLTLWGVKCLFPIIYSQYWFVQPFLCVLLLAPWINLIIDKLNTHNVCKAILVLACIEWIFPMILAPTVSSNVGHFILVYSIGAVIRKEKMPNRVRDILNNKTCNYGLILVGLLVTLGLLLAIDFALPQIGKEINSKLYMTFIGRFTFLPILTSLGLFLCFLRWKVSLPFVNYIAQSAFAVYLISESENVYPWFCKSYFDCINYYHTQYLIPMAIAQCLVVFVTCIIIDIIYRNIKSICSHILIKRT